MPSTAQITHTAIIILTNMATFHLTKKYQIFKILGTVDTFEAMPTEWDTYEEAEMFLTNALALGTFSSLYKYVILQTYTLS